MKRLIDDLLCSSSTPEPRLAARVRRHTLAKPCKLHVSILQSFTDLCTLHIKNSCHQYHPSRLVRSRRNHRPSTLHASFHRRQAVHHLRFRYHVKVQLSWLPCQSPLEFVLSLRSVSSCRLSSVVEVGPSTASLANQAPVYCGCPRIPAFLVTFP